VHKKNEVNLLKLKTCIEVELTEQSKCIKENELKFGQINVQYDCQV